MLGLDMIKSVTVLYVKEFLVFSPHFCMINIMKTNS